MSADADAGEAHERHGEQSGAEQGDGRALHRFRHFGNLKLLAHTGEYHESEREAQCRRHSVNHGFEQVVLFLDYRDGHAEDGAVGRNQGQEHAERLIERRHHFLHYYFEHLHQERNHKDERYGLHVLQSERVEHAGLQRPRDGRRQRDYERHGGTHSYGGADALRHSYEGANSEELRKDDVVYEYRRYDD